jgi:hypothetical protein
MSRGSEPAGCADTPPERRAHNCAPLRALVHELRNELRNMVQAGTQMMQFRAQQGSDRVTPRQYLACSNDEEMDDLRHRRGVGSMLAQALVEPRKETQTRRGRGTKTTTLVGVSVLASVMASGCGATSDGDLDQSDIGSTERLLHRLWVTT